MYVYLKYNDRKYTMSAVRLRFLEIFKSSQWKSEKLHFSQKSSKKFQFDKKTKKTLRSTIF